MGHLLRAASPKVCFFGLLLSSHTCRINKGLIRAHKWHSDRSICSPKGNVSTSLFFSQAYRVANNGCYTFNWLESTKKCSALMRQAFYVHCTAAFPPDLLRVAFRPMVRGPGAISKSTASTSLGAEDCRAPRLLLFLTVLN